MNFIQIPSWLRNRQVAIVAAIFTAYTLLTFGIYLARTLEGNIDNHILAGEMWGVPAQISKNGVSPLYHGAKETGWDGQFYYYIANDLLAKKDTPAHVDAPAYRYQRVGLSLYAAIVARLLGRDWVSPSTFIASYFVLVLVATILGARLLQQRKLSPYWFLLWALSAGTQLTLFNALPDAAADAFLIIALYVLFQGRLALSAIPFAFSALSREVYVLFPVVIWGSHLAFSFLETRQQGMGWKNLLRFSSYHWLVISVAVFLCWQGYLTHHFGMMPGSEAAGTLGAPYAAWFDYFVSGVNGHHKLLGEGFSSYAEGVSLLLFLCVDTIALVLAVFKLREFLRIHDIAMTGLAMVTLLLALLYACFGPTVMMHYTGYAKAMSVLLLLIMLLNSRSLECGIFSRKGVYVVMLAAVAVTSYYNLQERIFLDMRNYDQYTHMSQVTRNDEVPCFNEYRISMKVARTTLLRGGYLTHLFGGEDKMIFEVELTNLGSEPLVSSRNMGSVHMSSQWLDSSGGVVKDGIRSALPEVVGQGQSTNVFAVVPIPWSGKNLTLQLSPVQEGCAWFYRATPGLVADARVEIK